MSKKMGKTKVTTVDDLTAAGALELLGGAEEKKNESNRPFGQKLSEEYGTLMLEGNWVGLRVHVIRDKKKQVHNAQHCLKGLVWAQTMLDADPEYYKATYGVKGPLTIDIILEDEIETEWANFIDTGKARKQPDVAYRMRLFASSYSNAEQKTLARWQATASKIVWLRKHFGEKVRTSRKFRFADLTETLEVNPDLAVSTEFIFDQNTGDKAGSLKPLNIPAPYLAAAHYFASYSEMNEDGEPTMTDIANNFFIALITGTETGKGNPIYELREWLLKQVASKGNAALNRLYDAVVVAWNAWTAKTQITPKMLSGLKEDTFYSMGGWDTPPADDPEEAAEEPGEAEPAEELEEAAA